MESELGRLMVLGAAALGILYIFGKAPKVGKGSSCPRQYARRPRGKGAVWARGPVTADYAEDSLAFPAAPIM